MPQFQEELNGTTNLEWLNHYILLIELILTDGNFVLKINNQADVTEQLEYIYHPYELSLSQSQEQNYEITVSI